MAKLVETLCGNNSDFLIVQTFNHESDNQSIKNNDEDKSSGNLIDYLPNTSVVNHWGKLKHNASHIPLSNPTKATKNSNTLYSNVFQKQPASIHVLLLLMVSINFWINILEINKWESRTLSFPYSLINTIYEVDFLICQENPGSTISRHIGLNTKKISNLPLFCS